MDNQDNQMLDVEAHYEYELMNEAYKFLPTLLKRDFELDVRGRLVRKFVKDNKGESVQMNIIGEAIRNGNHFIVVGESKSHLSKETVEEFLHKMGIEHAHLSGNFARI